MSENNILAVLPYLKTTNNIKIYGIEFKNSKKISDLPSEAQKHFEQIFSMFFLKDDYQIKDMTYVYIETNDNKKKEKLSQLMKAQSLLTFFYSSPHPIFLDTFLTKEHANLFLFSPDEFSKSLIIPSKKVVNNKGVEKKEEGKVLGYEVKINNDKSNFWVTEDSRIYPPQGNFWLNTSQNLFQDVHGSFSKQTPFSKLLKTENIHSKVENRIFTALKWYNRSISLGINNETALVNLAIAFESLLDLKQSGQITKRFKEAVGLLVGSVPKLDNWLEQFYDARSQIVHEGRIEKIMFDAGESRYRSLVSYGRRIFQICLGTIISGSYLSLQMDLPSLFQTNRERFEEICKILRKNNFDSSKKAILSLREEINNIEKYKFIGEENLDLKIMLSSLKQIFKFYLETEPIIDEEIIDKIKKFVNNYSSYDDFDILSLLKEIVDIIEEKNIEEKDIEETFKLVKKLIESVWGYSFRIYYHLKDK